MSILLPACLLAYSGASQASPKRDYPFHADLSTKLGTQVPSMPNVSAIQHWTAEDSFNVLVQVAPTDGSTTGLYRLTFVEACHNLRWASNVGLSGSQDQVWAGFDYLTADNQRCSIRSINRL